MVEASSHGAFDGRFPQALVTGAPNVAAVTAGNVRVSPGYYSALGIAVRRGRTFSLEEARRRERVAIVSEATAARLWPDGDAIGKVVTLSPADAGQTGQRAVRIIGVVGDVVAGFYGERRDHPTVYEPGSVESDLATLVIASRSNGPSSLASIQRRLSPVDPSGSVEIRTLDESVAVQLYPFRAAHWVASALSVIALLLTITGIYGVLAFVVAMREKEIGIRLALGATRRAIIALVVASVDPAGGHRRRGGALMALGAARFISSHLTMIPAFNAIAFVAGMVIVLTAALAAAYAPSRRAASVDPVESLRRLGSGETGGGRR